MAQPLNATFFVFKKRERGGVLLGAAIAYVVVAIMLLGAFVAVNLGTLAAVVQWYFGVLRGAATGSPPDFSGFPASFGLFALSYIVLLFAMYILIAAYEAACLRWLVRGETGGLFGLSLGGDTWRVWGGYWVWFLLFLGFYVLLLLVVGGGVGVSALMLASSKDQGAAAGGVAMITVFVLTCVVAFAWIWVSTRLAPGAATSVGARRFAMFDAWKVSKGRFWSLFGAFLLTFILYLAGSFAMQMLIGASLGISMLAQYGVGGQPPDPAELMQRLASPQTLAMIGAIYLGGLTLAMLFMNLLFGINARAVIAAAQEGKVDGLAIPESLAEQFR